MPSQLKDALQCGQHNTRRRADKQEGGSQAVKHMPGCRLESTVKETYYTTRCACD